jgi:hypothetical protein
MSEAWRHKPRKPRPDLAERNRLRATHGLSGSPTQKSWGAMKRRCLNANDKDYPRYGGRGITVCDRWRDSFEAFVADMGVKPEGTSLDRIDNNGNYEPGNCRWAALDVQNNNRRSNRPITFKGRTQTLTQWAGEAGLSSEALAHRLKSGWPMGDALSIPIDHSNRRP